MGFKYKERIDPSALITVLYRCPTCGFECEETQPRNEQKAPDCPHCDEVQTEGPVPATTAMGEFRASKSTDRLYRVEEEGSQIRAEALDDPSMKITNMKDNFYGGGMREGDTTAMTPSLPNNPVTQYAAATGFNGGKFWGAGGGNTLEGALAKAGGRKGPDSGSGMKTITALQGGNGPMQFPTRAVPAKT